MRTTVRSHNVMVIASCALFTVAPPAMAELYKWGYSGTFTAVPAEYFAAGLRAGDSFSGAVTFDSSTPDIYPWISERGSYEPISSSISVASLSLNWTFSGVNTGRQITVLNDASPGFDFLEVYQRDIPLDSVSSPTKLAFFNGRAAGSLFPNDSIPIAPPSAASFEFLNLQFTDYHISSGSSAQGVVTQLQAIPEPSSYLMLLVGLAVILLRTRTRTK